MKDYVKIATEAAVEAGALLRHRASNNLEVLACVGKDVKLRADIEAERTVVDFLSDCTGFDILSEEAGLIERQSGAAYRWIVDPLDGTFNYCRGLPLACISIALWGGAEPILGVVYDFASDELFSGVVGEGAECNGAPIRVSETARSDSAVLCTGFPVGTDLSDAALALLIRRTQQFKKIRMLGSAALALAFVAAGKADAYAETDIRLWDVAAGIALVKAAGGTVKFIGSEAPYTLSVFAHNGQLEIP